MTGSIMSRRRPAFMKRLARTLVALLAALIALGRPLDAAAYAAVQEVDAGNPSLLLRIVAAFDVIDDAFDHATGAPSDEKGQIVVQLALPEPGAADAAIDAVTLVEHAQPAADPLTSRPPPPLDRPPRA